VAKHLAHWIKFQELPNEVEASNSSLRKTTMVKLKNNKQPVRYHLNQGRSSLLTQPDMEVDMAISVTRLYQQ
jgi:hypothetical protein